MPTARPTLRRAGATGPASDARAARDPFLDTIRTLALLRVTLWHAFGAPFLTYVLAAVPTMFFVTGSLLAKSLDRRPWPTVLVERARRVLVPLWCFGAVAFVAMRVAWVLAPSARTAVSWRSAVFWIVPLGDPQGSAWEGGWLSQPLWYVRAMFWLLLLSPLLRAAQRRIGLGIVALPLAALGALEIAARHAVSVPGAPQLMWQAGDVALYSVFLIGGFAHRDGRFERLRPRGWAFAGGVAAVAAAIWLTTQPVPLRVVNNSHPAHLFVGAAWLCVLFAARGPLTRLAARARPRAVVDWMSQRTMTIYLWHSTAIIVTYQLLARRPTLSWPAYVLAMIAGMVAVTAVFVIAFGWVEDVAARRRPRLVPLLRAPEGDAPARIEYRAHRARVLRLAGAPALAGIVVLGVAAAGAGVGPTAETSALDATPVRAARRPPVPSQAPPRPVFTPAPSTSAVPTEQEPATAVLRSVTADVSATTPAVDAGAAAALQTALDEWRVRWNVPGVRAGAIRPGIGEWVGASGADATTGVPTAPQDTFDIGSVTKTFTAAIVFQLVAQGAIDLDQPVPALPAVPALPIAGLTVRHLLEHRSGLVPYRDTPTYIAAPDAVDTPAAAVAASMREPLQFAPGTQTGYSSTNYLVLGFLIEHVTGQRFDDVLWDRVLAPAGVTSIVHTAPGPQAPNFATGGLVTDAATLLRWTTALYRDGLVIDPSALAAMHRIDTRTGLGPGVYGYCPCTLDADGGAHWRWIGHSGGTTQIAYSDADDLAIVIDVTDSLWLTDRGAAIAELQEILRLRMLELHPPDELPAFPEDAPEAAPVGVLPTPAHPADDAGEEPEEQPATADVGPAPHEDPPTTTVAPGADAAPQDPEPVLEPGVDPPAEPRPTDLVAARTHST